jgi:hypothetical protein
VLSQASTPPRPCCALARYLHGKDFPAVGLSRLLQPVALAANALPRRARENVYAWSGWSEALPPEKLGQVRAEEVARGMVGAYPQRRFPAVAIGSSSGALVHLCAALGIPWLPQTFLIPVRQSGVHPDDPQKSLEAGIAPARALLTANPELVLHHMHDPNQDRLMLRHMTYFRVKRLGLGAAFERFLEETLEPGGVIVLAEGRCTWPTTAVAERHIFQFGAVGGATPEEYFHGGPRVAAFLGRYGSRQQHWEPPEPDGERPEAEWGFESALRADTQRFARQRGYRVVRLLFDDPEHLSPLVADLHRWWHRQRGMPADRLLVESFILMEPWWAMRTGAVPFWMTFTTEPSAAWLERYLEGAEPYNDIRLMLFAHGTDSVGIASIARWRQLLERARRQGRFVGVDEDKYPRDFATFARYHSKLKQIADRYPIPEPLTVSQLNTFLTQAGDRYPVQWLADTYVGGV